MLKIENLQARVGDTQILRGINLNVNAGEIHAIMGPNGSGKSTLAQVLAGREGYEVTGGSASFLEQDLLDMDPEERAREGLFLAFQYPVEIPGVNSAYFLRTGYNEMCKHRGKEELDAMDFLSLVREKLKLVEMDESFLKRSVNEGFSGGEKKRHEVLQMAVLEPRLAILDETDSPDKAAVVVTHYQRLLEYIVPDYVHVLYKGCIVRSGGKELALELEEKGYDWVKDEAVGAAV